MKPALICCWLLLAMTACFQAVDTQPTMGKGFVTDEGGKPVAGVTVFFEAIKIRAVSGGSKIFAETYTNAQGYYEISYLVPAGYEYPSISIAYMNGPSPFKSSAPYKQGKIANGYLTPQQTTQVDWVYFK
jgi:hypothetical protein